MAPRYIRSVFPYQVTVQWDEEERTAELLRALCDGIPSFPAAHTGRPAKPASDMVYAMVLKVFGGMSCRRAQSDLRAAESKGHVDKAAHYNTVLKYFEDQDLPLVQHRDPVADTEGRRQCRAT